MFSAGSRWTSYAYPPPAVAFGVELRLRRLREGGRRKLEVGNRPYGSTLRFEKLTSYAYRLRRLISGGPPIGGEQNWNLCDFGEVKFF